MDWLTSWMGDYCCCRNSQSLDPSCAEMDIPDPLRGGGGCKPKPRLFFFFFFEWVTTAAAATVSHLIQVVQKWIFPILWGWGWGLGGCKPKPRLFFFFFFGWVTTAAAATVSHLIQVVQKWMFPILWGEGVDRNPDSSSSSSSVLPSYFSGVHHFG